MLFNSIQFLFFFLPLVLAGFLVLQKTGKLRLVILWLIGCSLLFYAWWSPVYLLLLLFSVCVNYALGVFLIRGGKEKGRNWLVLGVAFNLGLLGYFKYANFFLDNIQLLTSSSFNFRHIILPLAISFYTFQQIAYLVDSRKGITKRHGFLDYSLFVSFFPQLIAGPIVHHGEMLSQFDKLTNHSNTYRNICIGVSIIIIGLFKKVVIADSFALFATPVFDIAATGGDIYTMDAVAGTFSYAFQLYFDFSGYCDMAIGVACLFGIKLPVNFFSPFRAANISDFWRMWHATLSRFLRVYVYNSLGGFLCSPRRQRFNLFATMFLAGIWHGAGWTFVVYGVCHGSYVVIHQLWRINVSGPMGFLNNKAYMLVSQGFTFLLVALTLGVFRADSMTTAGHIYGAMLRWNGGVFVPAYITKLESTNIMQITSMILGDFHNISVVFISLSLALAACWLLPSTFQLFRHCEVTIAKPLAGREPVLQLQWQPNRKWGIYIATLAFISMMNLTQMSEFLYFQF